MDAAPGFNYGARWQAKVAQHIPRDILGRELEIDIAVEAVKSRTVLTIAFSSRGSWSNPEIDVATRSVSLAQMIDQCMIIRGEMPASDLVTSDNPGLDEMGGRAPDHRANEGHGI